VVALRGGGEEEEEEEGEEGEEEEEEFCGEILNYCSWLLEGIRSISKIFNTSGSFMC
jgi:hypothetical protein